MRRPHTDSIVVLFLILVVTHVESDRGRWCFECQGVANPADCGHVRQCDTDQQCFTEKYDTSMGFPQFNSGCEDDSICSKYRKRDYYIHQVGDVTVCKTCCNKTDGCNAELCHSHPLTNGNLCFDCQGADSPDYCQSVTMCKHSQACAWTLTTSTFTKQPVYEMGCLSDDECGKNSTFCCHGNFCNSMKEFDCQSGAPPLVISPDKLCDGNNDCPNSLDESSFCNVNKHYYRP